MRASNDLMLLIRVGDTTSAESAIVGASSSSCESKAVASVSSRAGMNEDKAFHCKSHANSVKTLSNDLCLF